MMASGLSPGPNSCLGPSIGFRVSGRAGLAQRAGLHERSAAAVADERDDLADDRIAFELAGNGLRAFGEAALAVEQHAIGAVQPVHVGPRDAAPPQSHDVQADKAADRGPEYETERDDVFAGPAQAADHRALADADELMHGCLSAEEHVVADDDMAAEDGIVGEGHVI